MTKGSPAPSPTARGPWYPRNHPEPEFARTGYSLKNWVRRQLSQDAAIPRKDLTARARKAGYVPFDARGSQFIGGTLYYLQSQGELEIRNGVVHAVALAHRLNTSDIFDLSKLVRRRIRGKGVVNRVDLRADLRAARLLSWGTLGGRRLAAVLRAMSRAGEVTLTPTTVQALDLRSETKRRKLHRPPSAKDTKRLGAERRARKAEERRARLPEGMRPVTFCFPP